MSEVQINKRLDAKSIRVLKLLLDAVMLVLLALMYQEQVVSMAFHEIGGLALIGLFLIHHLLNAKWIGATTRHLFAKGMSGLVRARYLVDALLLLAFLTVGITGVLISKVVFSLHVAGNFKTLHYFSSALAILLLGVHLGLHVNVIFGKLLKKGANKVAKIALCVVLAAMVAFGGYSLLTTSFVSYLTSPLQAARFSHGDFQPSGAPALDGSTEERPTDLSKLPEFSTDNGTQPSLNDAQPPQDGAGGGFGGNGGNGPSGGFGGGESRGEGKTTNAALLVAQYVSIAALFGAATYGVLYLACALKKQPQSGLAVTEADSSPDKEP